MLKKYWNSELISVKNSIQVLGLNLKLEPGQFDQFGWYRWTLICDVVSFDLVYFPQSQLHRLWFLFIWNEWVTCLCRVPFQRLAVLAELTLFSLFSSAVSNTHFHMHIYIVVVVQYVRTRFKYLSAVFIFIFFLSGFGSAVSFAVHKYTLFLKAGTKGGSHSWVTILRRKCFKDANAFGDVKRSEILFSCLNLYFIPLYVAQAGLLEK